MAISNRRFSLSDILPYRILCVVVVVDAAAADVVAVVSVSIEDDSIYLKSVCHLFKHHLQHVNDDFP